MRAQERATLEEQYEPNDARPLDERFADSLGLGLRHVRELHDAVNADLDETTHGVRWWASLPIKQRVVIGDHLLDCVDSIETNLVEAELHYWELLDWWERQNQFLATGRVISQPPYFFHPERRAPVDDLPERMIQLHTAGLVRALGSVLDCIAAAIIGVVGLPLELLPASFQQLVRYLDPAATRGRRLGTPTTPAGLIQGRFRDAFLGELRTAGPTDWHKWLLNFRNMLVHRGRRLGTSILHPVRDGNSVRVAEQRVLPNAPELSQVEAWARWGGFIGGTARHHFLSEPADETLRRVSRSVARTAARTCEELCRTWQARRNDPDVLPQPIEQWPDIPHNEPSAFEGYAPGSIDADIDAMIGGTNLHRRIRVAALDTASNQPWR